MSIPLTPRLQKAASLVGFSPFSTAENSSRCGKGIVVCDVGCDHAYLSLTLVLSGKCEYAVASDLREGPLVSARANVEAYGCESRITTVQTNGLQGLDVYHPTDIVICGMGGDTMMDILSRADFIKKNGMRLILQPQSAFAELALFLADLGFRILAERYAVERNKAYRIIALEYDSVSRELSLPDALIGKLSFEEDKVAYHAFCRKILHTVDKKIQGAHLSHQDPSPLTKLRESISELILL